MVRVSDGAGGTDTAAVTVRVGGADLPDGAAVAESQTADMSFDLTFPGLTNGRITAAATAVQGVTVTRVDGDTIRVMGALDHESLSGGMLPIMLTVAADGGISFTQTVQLPVTDVNEAPETSGDAAFAVAEGGRYTLTAADLSATDEDAGDGAAQLTWRVTTAPANGRLELSTASGTAITSFTQAQLAAGQVVYVHDGSDASTDSFVARVEDDAATPLMAAAVTVSATVTAVDDPPTAVTLTGTTTSLAENTGTALDFEGGNTQLDVTVRVGASGPSQDLRIMVTDVDEAPVFAANQRFTVAPSAANNAVVGTVAVNDPEDSNALTFSITAGNTGSTFAIDNNGRITVADATQIDADATPSYTLTVQVVDGSHTVTGSITVAVATVQQPPTGVSLSSSVAPRGETGGWTIGRLSATDPDGGANPTFTWAVSDTTRFEEGNGFLTLRSGVSLSSDASVTVTATDAQGLNAEQTFAIRALQVRSGMDSIADRDTGSSAVRATSSTGEVLRGQEGSDELVGGGGADIIDGGRHDDDMTGGAGGDVFVYRFDSSGATPGQWAGLDGNDEITDFSIADGDRLMFIDRSGVIDTLEEFKAGFPSGVGGTGAYVTPILTIEGSTDVVSFQFANNEPADSENGISGQNRIEISGASAFDTRYYSAEDGTIGSADDLIAILGGEDAFLFG